MYDIYLAPETIMLIESFSPPHKIFYDDKSCDISDIKNLSKYFLSKTNEIIPILEKNNKELDNLSIK
jgi:hypothetical protein